MTIKTTGPTAGTMPLLMTEEFSLALSRAPGNPIPIGAGPYRVPTSNPGLSIRMEKWDGFFRADDFGVKTLEYTNIPDGGGDQRAERRPGRLRGGEPARRHGS